MTEPTEPGVLRPLVEWLETAINELADAAREAKYGGTWIAARHEEMPLVCADVAAIDDEGELREYVATDVERSTAVHIALHDPESALRQCAAGRKILARYERLAAREQKSFAMCVKLDALEEVLRDLAEGYGYEEKA